MFRLKTTIAGFLMYSRQLIFGVRDDALIRERILKYGFDEVRITECVDIYYEAEKAQSDRLKEYGEQLGAKEVFDEVWEEAKSVWQEHTDILKLTVRDDIDKQRKLFLIGQPESNKISDWFEHMKAMYDRVLADDEVVAAGGRYGLTVEVLQAGRQKVVGAEDAKRKHKIEQAEAEEATERRNVVFMKLQSVVEDLETICPYILKDVPQHLEKIGIPVLSPGYKRTSEETPEEPPVSEEPQQQGEVTEDPQAASGA
jgi:hypothetical protein